MKGLAIGISLMFFFILFPGGEAEGQPYCFNHFQVENGVSNNSVECSIQDDDGFLWFGTISGLNRFDGYAFKMFYTYSTYRNASDPLPISIGKICPINDSSFLIGTKNEGVK